MLTTQNLEKLKDSFTEGGQLHAFERAVLEFNIHEAHGAGRSETYNSKALGALLRPVQGIIEPTAVLRTFLKASLTSNDKILETISSQKLKHTQILCDKEHFIDILIVNHELKFIVAIENKIDADESSNQLTRYVDTIKNKSRYANDYNHAFFYLTVNGDPIPISKTDKPEDNVKKGYRNQWQRISHSEVTNTLKQAFKKLPKKTTPHDYTIMLKNYIKFMERNILPDTNLQTQAQKLYNNHSDAFKEIYKYSTEFDMKYKAVTYLKSVIDTDPDFILDRSDNYIRFYYNDWTNIAVQGCHEILKKNKNIPVIFEVCLYDRKKTGDSYVKLILPIDKSVSERLTIREEVSKRLSPNTKNNRGKAEKRYTSLWECSKPFNMNNDEIFKKGYEGIIDDWWGNFKKDCADKNVKKIVDEAFEKYSKP